MKPSCIMSHIFNSISLGLLIFSIILIFTVFGILLTPLFLGLSLLFLLLGMFTAIWCYYKTKPNVQTSTKIALGYDLIIIFILIGLLIYSSI